MALPNFILAGVVKGGTTSVYRYLNEHPEVCGSKIKETCFFLPKRYGKALPSIDEYEGFFPDEYGNFKVVFESTPGYLHGGQKLAHSLKENLGEIKICFILRDPVERTRSFFKYQQGQLLLPKTLSFGEYINQCESFDIKELHKQENDNFFGIQGSMYSKCLEEWFTVFGAENVFVLDFDVLKSNPKQFMKSLSTQIEINEFFYDEYDFEIENKTRLPKIQFIHNFALKINKIFEVFFRKYPAIKSKLRTIYFVFNEKKNETISNDEVELDGIFSEDVIKLSNLLKLNGKPLPNWVLKYESVLCSKE